MKLHVPDNSGNARKQPVSPRLSGRQTEENHKKREGIRTEHLPNARDTATPSQSNLVVFLIGSCKRYACHAVRVFGM